MYLTMGADTDLRMRGDSKKVGSYPWSVRCQIILSVNKLMDMKVGRPTFVPAKDTFCTRNFPKTIDWILVKLTNILPVRKHSRWLIVYSSQGLRSNKPRSYPNQLLSRSHPNYSPYQPVASWHTTKVKSLRSIPATRRRRTTQMPDTQLLAR